MIIAVVLLTILLSWELSTEFTSLSKLIIFSVGIDVSGVDGVLKFLCFLSLKDLTSSICFWPLKEADNSFASSNKDFLEMSPVEP